MNLLLDQGVGRAAAALLREAGFEARHVAEIGLASATDEAILELARHDDSVIVTFDRDFHKLLATTGALTPSVIYFRGPSIKSPLAVAAIIGIIHRWVEYLAAGAAITVRGNKVRVRHLPLRPPRSR